MSSLSRLTKPRMLRACSATFSGSSSSARCLASFVAPVRNSSMFVKMLCFERLLASVVTLSASFKTLFTSVSSLERTPLASFIMASVSPVIASLASAISSGKNPLYLNTEAVSARVLAMKPWS